MTRSRVYAAAALAGAALVVALVSHRSGGEFAEAPAAAPEVGLASPSPGPPTPGPLAPAEPHRARLPPGPDGVAPPEDPGAAAEIAANDAYYTLNPEQAAHARHILATDRDFQTLLHGATYTVTSTAAWRGSDAPAKGASLELEFTKPLTVRHARVPARVRNSAGEFVRSSFVASLENVRRMSVLVGFADEAVLDVQAD